MRCPKCKVIAMYDDPDRLAGIEIYACYACGNRVYLGYPKRRGGGKDPHVDPEPITGGKPARGKNTVVPFPQVPKKRTVAR